MRMQYLAKIAIAGLAMVLPYTVNAASNDWYVGIGLGQSENKTRLSKLGGTGFIGTVDNEDSTWKLFGGYRLWDEYVAVEVSYVDLGATTATGTSGGLASTGTHELETFTIGAAGYIPITDSFGVLIHLGFSRNASKLNTTVGGTSAFAGATDFEPYGGFGAQYDFSKTIGGRAEFQRFVVDGYAVNLLSAGIFYRF